MDFGFAAHDYNKTRLNRATYSDLRDKYPTLPSALIQSQYKETDGSGWILGSITSQFVVMTHSGSPVP